MCRSLRPVDDMEQIKLWQRYTTEAASCVMKKGSLPLGGISDIRAGLKRAEMSGMLTTEELMRVADFIYVCRKAVNYSKGESLKREIFELLDPEFDMLRVPVDLEREINRCIVNETTIADDASAALSTIRKNIKISNNRIREQLNAVLQSQTYKNMLQDSVITIRGGRYCVPVKQEFKGQFSGMVHDQSSTGATVFIEPMSVVNLNNKIKELEAEESQEVNRILYRLTAQVAENAAMLSLNNEILTKLDFIFAKGELSNSMIGTEPKFNTWGKINIVKGRHPLLNKETVVPTNIYLGDGFTVLMVTGPNTGGKTVALKTLGLFTLMGQAGLHIPAAEHSELAVFDEVFADIGDEQSIEQSLSTFSGHMTNIVKILRDVTPLSLVLLDELGAGTDPTEGAALAVAIIERLRELGARLAVTTHYSELKVYALSTEGVENAACEFDLETLRPTYKLLIGIPGKSNAFAISKKLGLTEDIIDRARNVLSGADIRFEDVITDLEISKKTVELEQQKAEQYRIETEKIRTEVERLETKLKNQREKMVLEAKNEARYIVDQAKKESDRIIKGLRKIQAESANAAQIEESRQKLREMAGSLNDDIADMVAPNHRFALIDRPLITGDKVFVKTLNQSAVVLSADDGGVTVQSGFLKVKVAVGDLTFDLDEDKPSPKYGKKLFEKIYNDEQKGGASKALNISPKIDLRGNLVEEAIEKVDKYIDDASLAGLAKIEIVHGKGTGALRSAVQAHLKRHPLIKTYRLGVFGEGEDGVTIAELK